MQQISATTNNVYSGFLYKKGDISKAVSVAKAGLDTAIATHNKFSVITLAGILQKSYDTKKNTDSAHHYSEMVLAYRDSVFSQQKMLQVQNYTFKRQNEEREAELQKKKLAEERKQNLQYAAIGIGLFMVFLLLSRSVKVSKRMIQFLGTLSMLLAFEFINLLLHPYLGELTHHQPLFMLLFLAAIAAVLIPAHHKLEHWIIHKLVGKNEKRRLKSSDKVARKGL